MKRVLVDGNLLLQGLKEDDSSHQGFAVLWELLTKGTIQAYITRVDLVRVSHQLKNEIEDCPAEALVAIIQRVFQVWTGEEDVPLDAIVSERPQDFADWDAPVLSITEFLKRYDLLRLLELSVEVPEVVESPLVEQNRKLQTALVSSLLILPLLARFWGQSDRVLEELKALAMGVMGRSASDATARIDSAKSSDEAAIANILPVQDGTFSLSSFQPIFTPSSSGGTELRFASLPSIDLNLENDIPFEVQMGSDGSTVNIRLHLREQSATGEGAEDWVATIRRSDTGEAIARIVNTSEGTWIAAVQSYEGSNTDPAEASETSILAATVTRNADGSLTTALSPIGQPTSSPLAFSQSDRTLSTGQGTITNPALVSVRYFDRTPDNPATPIRGTVEVRLTPRADGMQELVILSNPGTAIQIPETLIPSRIPENEEFLEVQTEGNEEFGIYTDNYLLYPGSNNTEKISGITEVSYISFKDEFPQEWQVVEVANPAVGGDRLAPRPGVQVAHHNAGGGARPILPTAAIQASALPRDVLLTGGRSPEEIIRIDTGNGLLIDFQSSPGAAQQPSYEAASFGSSLGHMIVPTGFPGIEKFPPILASALSPTPIG